MPSANKSSQTQPRRVYLKELSPDVFLEFKSLDSNTDLGYQSIAVAYAEVCILSARRVLSLLL